VTSKQPPLNSLCPPQDASTEYTTRSTTTQINLSTLVIVTLLVVEEGRILLVRPFILRCQDLACIFWLLELRSWISLIRLIRNTINKDTIISINVFSYLPNPSTFPFSLAHSRRVYVEAALQASWANTNNIDTKLDTLIKHYTFGPLSVQTLVWKKPPLGQFVLVTSKQPPLK